METPAPTEEYWAIKVGQLSHALGALYDTHREREDYPCMVLVPAPLVLELLDVLASLKTPLRQMACNRNALLQIGVLAMKGLS